LLAELATFRWIMEGAANHRYWISRCVLFEIRHVSTEFSAAPSGDICQLSLRPRPSAQLLSQQSVGWVRISVVGAAAQRREPTPAAWQSCRRSRSLTTELSRRWSEYGGL